MEKAHLKTSSKLKEKNVLLQRIKKAFCSSMCAMLDIPAYPRERDANYNLLERGSANIAARPKTVS